MRDMSANLVYRFRRWVILAIAFGAVSYLAFSVIAGFGEVREALSQFSWWAFIPVILLTLLNYGLRFGKWHYLIGRLGVKMPIKEDAWNFIAGLSMVISPGKAGELLKPYVVRELTQAPMARTIPALVTERLTDAIALLILASISVSTYAGDRIEYLIIPSALIILGLGVLASTKLTTGILDLLAHLHGIKYVEPKLREMVGAMRTCVAPIPLVVTTLVSVVAWGAECVGFLLIFYGMGIDASLDICIFLYCFATIAGGAMPGGLGVSDGALALGAVTLLGISDAEGTAAALLIRTATLWLGVGMGAIALFRVSEMLGGNITLNQETDSA